MIYVKSNDMSLDNSSKKIITDIKIFNLYAYLFLSQYTIKLLKKIIILWFALESNVKEPKYIYLQVK